MQKCATDRIPAVFGESDPWALCPSRVPRDFMRREYV